jgi:hypothetical protein
MLDFLSSKGALTLAALLMLSLMLMVVDTTNEAAEQRNYDVVVEGIANTLSEVNSSPGNVSIALVFDDSSPNIAGIHYPQTIGGDEYQLLFFSDTIVITDSSGKMRSMANVHGDIHGWLVEECSSTQDPEDFGLTSEQISYCDENLENGEPWIFDMGNAKVLDITRGTHRVDGEMSYLTSVKLR